MRRFACRPLTCPISANNLGLTRTELTAKAGTNQTPRRPSVLPTNFQQKCKKYTQKCVYSPPNNCPSTLNYSTAIHSLRQPLLAGAPALRASARISTKMSENFTNSACSDFEKKKAVRNCAYTIPKYFVFNFIHLQPSLLAGVYKFRPLVGR